MIVMKRRKVKRRSDNYVPSKLCNWKERERERERDAHKSRVVKYKSIYIHPTLRRPDP
jgi:hypothetical protein